MTLEVAVLLGFAVYRLAWLFTKDSIFEPVRVALYDWAWVETTEGPEAGKPVPRGHPGRCWLYSLVSCPLCLGVWFSFAAVTAWGVPWGRHWLLAVFAIAGVQVALTIPSMLLLKLHEAEDDS